LFCRRETIPVPTEQEIEQASEPVSYCVPLFARYCTGQQISKKLFVSVMNMLLIYLFASMKLEKGHKESLGSSFQIMPPL